MKLIKINTDHYIMVDDSEIKEGDLCYDPEGSPGYNNIKYVVKCLRTASDSYWNKHCKKITHSTQALGIGWQQEVIELSLQEVKELIGEVDVAEISYLKKLESSNQDKNWIGYGKGIDGVSKEKWKRIYNQALEDNKEKKYTEEDVIAIVEKSRATGLTAEYIIQSLQQPITQWDIEFDSQGKLKLKK